MEAPRFLDVWPMIVAILRRFRRVLVYNAAFDRSLLEATVSRYGLRIPGGQWECLMEQYAVYHGAWSHSHGSSTWQPLTVACASWAWLFLTQRIVRLPTRSPLIARAASSV